MDTALLAFDVDGLNRGLLLRPFDALVWMEALADTLARLGSEGGGASACFTSQTTDDPRADRRVQSLLLPISHDASRARVDHVLVHVPAGFDDRAIFALERLRHVERKGAASVVAVLVDLGKQADFEKKVPHFGTSSVWRSVTPFVPAKSLQSNSSRALESHVQSELVQWGLPEAASMEIEIEGGKFAPVTAIAVAPHGPKSSQGRSGSSGRLTLTASHCLRLRFERPVRGPITLGFGSRFGMGQFVPG